MTKKFIDVPMNETKKILEKLQTGIAIIANARITLRETDALFETECARIERCLEHEYKISKEEMDFNVFALEFIKYNLKDLVLHSNYSGTYLSDVQDVQYKDDLQKETL